jgi:uncharacterized membrane protein YeaQ/YmgE (transglycosylase-associated protein family)
MGCVDLLVWIVFGLTIGAVARLIVPGRDPMGCLGTALLGIVGSMIGGMLGHLLVGHGPYRPAGFIGSLVGAVIALLIWRRLGSRRVPPYY